MEYSKSRYGLLLPASKEKKAVPIPSKRAAAFDDDSEDEVEKQEDWVKCSLKKICSTSGIKKQTKINLAKTLKEDPTAFEYDEVYDEMQAEKEKALLMRKSLSEKKPKYIQSLLKEAEKRKLDFERRKEREVQKEREAEGDMFRDKEAFVTTSYRKKMEEMAKIDAEEEKLKQIEDILDVRKQNDLSGFYRHLYRQTMGEEKLNFTEKSAPLEETQSESKDSEELIKRSQSNKRSYRSRKTSENADLSESNPDEDTDLESDTDSNSDSDSKSDHKLSSENSKTEKKMRNLSDSNTADKADTNLPTDSENTAMIKVEDKKKVNIFAHRNTAEDIEAARQRYFERVRNKGIS